MSDINRAGNIRITLADRACRFGRCLPFYHGWVSLSLSRALCFFCFCSQLRGLPALAVRPSPSPSPSHGFQVCIVSRSGHEAARVVFAQAAFKLSKALFAFLEFITFITVLPHLAQGTRLESLLHVCMIAEVLVVGLCCRIIILYY